MEYLATETAIAILVGLGTGLITGLIVSLVFYHRATEGLKLETKKLRQLNKLILLALQNNGMADLNFDEDGEITGLNVSVLLPAGSLRFDNPETEDGKFVFDDPRKVRKTENVDP